MSKIPPPAPEWIPAPDRRTQPRFIPREELSNFSSWKPDAINNDLNERFAAMGVHKTPQADEQSNAAPEDEELATSQARAQQIASLIGQAREAGYHDGYRDGLVALEAFKQKFAQQSSAQVGQWIQAFDEQMQQIERQMSTTVVDIAVALARQVVRNELRTQPELISTVAQDAVSSLVSTAKLITVRVNPDDLHWVEQGAKEVLNSRDARLIADPHVPVGGCLVESDSNTLDMSIEQRWQRAASSLGHDLSWLAREAALDAPLPPADA